MAKLFTLRYEKKVITYNYLIPFKLLLRALFLRVIHGLQISLCNAHWMPTSHCLGLMRSILP